MSRRRWWIVGGIAAIMLAVAAGLWIWQATTRSPTPEEAAREYLQALASGDRSAVEATGVEVSASALTAYAAATALIRDVEVAAADGEGRREGDGAKTTVETSFRLGGDAHTAELSLTHTGGRWTVDASGLGTMTATTTIGGFVTIGEEAVPSGQAVSLLPAAYAVSAAPSDLLEGEAALEVLPGSDSALEIEVSIRPEATAAAQQQLDEHLTACTVPGSAPPEGCGIRIPWGTEFRTASEFRYRVEQLPTIALTGPGFNADGGVLVATVTGTGQDGAERTTTYRTESWSVRGEVSFTADDVLLTVW